MKSKTTLLKHRDAEGTEFHLLPSLCVRRVEYPHQRKKLERQFEEWQRSQKS